LKQRTTTEEVDQAAGLSGQRPPESLCNQHPGWVTVPSR
jgi:hypothetical protein